MPLSIAVCVKRVPDTAAAKVLDPGDFTLDRDGVESILNPVDEVAVEAALRLSEEHGGQVTAVIMGPDEGATKALRRALAMGCHAGILLSDPALHGSDALATAYALAGVLRPTPWDLVLCGSESTDARTGLVPPALAELLGLPALLQSRQVIVSGGTVRTHREQEHGYDVLEATLPALVGVNWGAYETRYPSFKGIQDARKKPVEVLDAAAAGLDLARLGLAGSHSQVLGAAPRSAERGRVMVTDAAGDAHRQLADFLQQGHFI